MNLSKTDLIQEIADKSNASKSDAQRFFDAFTEVVTDSLKKGEQVQITGFGKFYVQKRDARQGINPQTKQRINIPASKVPKFTAGNALKDSIGSTGTEGEDIQSIQAVLSTLAELDAEEQRPALAKVRNALTHLPSLAEERNSREALLAARARNTVRVLEDRARLRGECVPAKSVAEGLGVSRQRLHQLRKQGRLLAVLPQDRRVSLYPAWQFTEEGEIVEGLDQVIQAAREVDIDEETLHFFMVEPNDRLQGELPADLLARGEVDQVVKVLDSAGLGPF